MADYQMEYSADLKNRDQGVSADKRLESHNACPDEQSDSDSESEWESARWANRLGVSQETLARFWAKVTTTGSCWLWTANRVRGYGQFVLERDWRGKQPHVYAHRFAYELTHGRIRSADIKACHRCDTPLCCRPSHLFLGSQADNLADARRKGRLDESRPRRTAKLTPTDRLAIFTAVGARGIGVQLARLYGVRKATISKIRRGLFVRLVDQSIPPRKQTA